MSNIDNLLASARSTGRAEAAWDSARSRRVFEGAVRSRAGRHRRQRFVAFACAASAAMFVLGVHAASAHSHTSFQASIDDGSESSTQVSNASDLSGGLSTGAGGAIAMSSDLFADGGRETD